MQLSLSRPTSRSYTTAFLDFIWTNFAIIPSGQICLSIFVPRSIQMGPDEVLCFRAVRPSVRTYAHAWAEAFAGRLAPALMSTSRFNFA